MSSNLNKILEQLDNEYNINQKTINQKHPERHFDKNENEMNIKEMMKTQIDNTNKMNDKFNSFLTDKSICVNNPYYNVDNQPSSINTRKHEILNNNNFNIDKDPNTRLKQFQFQHYNNNQINNNINGQSNNSIYNKLSPFDELNRDKNKYVKKKNLIITSDNHTPLGRAIATSHNINYEINENFKNHSKNKITNKDISNERLNEFSPLSKTSQIPIKTKAPPNLTDEMEKFLTSYNTFKQSSLNTNFKKVAKETFYNDINPTYVGENLINETPKDTRLN